MMTFVSKSQKQRLIILPMVLGCIILYCVVLHCGSSYCVLHFFNNRDILLDVYSKPLTLDTLFAKKIKSKSFDV